VKAIGSPTNMAFRAASPRDAKRLRSSRRNSDACAALRRAFALEREALAAARRCP
jgi:hypothetical protein